MVVVGIEPLGQVEGGDSLPIDFASSRHGKVALTVNRLADGGEPRRDRTHHDRGVKHLIVEREVV